jgi:hypothetical protein
MTSASGASSLSQCVCLSGYTYSSASQTCVVCAIGSWCPGGNITTTAVQIQCPANSQTQTTGSTSATACRCIAGFFGAFGSNCTACPIGQFCLGGASGNVASQCPSNSTTLYTQSTAASACLCVSGFKGNSSTNVAPCVKCASGEVCLGGSNGALVCPPNSMPRAGGTTTQDCVCNAGYVGNNGATCNACGVGSYCLGGNRSTPCPSNSVSVAGSATLSSCICSASYYGPLGGPCSPCPLTSYCAGGGANIIGPCPSTSMTFGLASSVSQCFCGPGKYGNASNCSSCNFDKYCVGGMAGPAVETACPANSWTQSQGSTLATDCRCKAGYYGANGQACTACGSNFWCPGASTTRTLCPANSRTTTTTASASTACVCNPGYYGGNGGNCTLCTAGSYCPGGTQITACPSNSESAAGSEISTNCKCKPSYYGVNGGTCTLCQAGYFCLGANDRYG